MSLSVRVGAPDGPRHGPPLTTGGRRVLSDGPGVEHALWDAASANSASPGAIHRPTRLMPTKLLPGLACRPAPARTVLNDRRSATGARYHRVEQIGRTVSGHGHITRR
ncbi:MAG: hypothetical protein ACLQPH_01525 [Acidimicrobiales bacterium]